MSVVFWKTLFLVPFQQIPPPFEGGTCVFGSRCFWGTARFFETKEGLSAGSHTKTFYLKESWAWTTLNFGSEISIIPRVV